MGVPIPRTQVRYWELNGVRYENGYPCSELGVVLHITNKLRAKDLSKVKIEEHRMRAFASVYVRIRQVPRTSQQRLEKWFALHDDETQDWDLGDFRNTTEKDVREGKIPREPGIPPEAKLEGADNVLKRKRGSLGENFPLNILAKHPELACETQQEYMAKELEAASRSFETLQSTIVRMASQLDDGDELKHALERLTGTAGSNLARVNKAAKISSELIGDLAKTAAAGEDDIVDEEKLEARIRQKRARAAREVPGEAANADLDEVDKKPPRSQLSRSPARTAAASRACSGYPKSATVPARGGPRRVRPNRENSTTLSPQKTVEQHEDEDDEEEDALPSRPNLGLREVTDLSPVAQQIWEARWTPQAHQVAQVVVYANSRASPLPDAPFVTGGSSSSSSSDNRPAPSSDSAASSGLAKVAHPDVSTPPSAASSSPSSSPSSSSSSKSTHTRSRLSSARPVSDRGSTLTHDPADVIQQAVASRSLSPKMKKPESERQMTTKQHSPGDETTQSEGIQKKRRASRLGNPLRASLPTSPEHQRGDSKDLAPASAGARSPSPRLSSAPTTAANTAQAIAAQGLRHHNNSHSSVNVRKFI